MTRLLVLGVGDAFSARYYSSCLALEAEGAWLLIDCPHPIRKMLREAGQSAGITLDLTSLTGVALTHLHADHCSGLEVYGFYMRFVVGRKARLAAHPDVSNRLWTHHLAAGMQEALIEVGKAPTVRTLEDFFDLTALDYGKPTQLGPFRIHCRRTQHMVPTTAFRIEAGGRTLGYSADTAFDPGLIDWLAPADLILHESTPGMLHTPYERLLGLPAPLRNKMKLIHYPDTFDVAASQIEPLRQGCMYDV